MKLFNRSLMLFLTPALLLLVLLTSCVANPGVSSLPGNPTGYPAGDGIQSQPVEKSTIAPSLGVVTGVLQLKGKPVEGTSLGLGEVVKDTNGVEIATSYDRINSPQASTAADGSFTIINAPPGRYGLIYANGPETYLLLKPGNPDKKEAVLISVSAGQKVDLGVLNYTELPDTPK